MREWPHGFRSPAAPFSIIAPPLPRRPGCRPGSSSASCRRPGRRRPRSSSPNDRPGIALIGCGGMGRGDLKSASRFANVVALCDVDVNHAPKWRKQYATNRTPPEQFTDFRRVLDRKDVDIIINATPDHWHTLVNLAAAAREEGHLRREAADADHRRRQAGGQGGAQGKGRFCRPARSSAATSCSGWPASWRATGGSASSRR